MASDPPGSSPASSKSESVQASKEDAETTATRKELRNTSISGSNNNAPRSGTPEVPEGKVASEDQVSSPKKKRAHDQLEDDSAATSSSLNVCFVLCSRDLGHNCRVSENDPCRFCLFGDVITNTSQREKGRAQSLEPEKKRQRDELASDKGETSEQGKSGGSQAVCYSPLYNPGSVNNMSHSPPKKQEALQKYLRGRVILSQALRRSLRSRSQTLLSPVLLRRARHFPP